MGTNSPQDSGPDNPSKSSQDAARPWTGGVVRIRGMRHRGKPLRVAAWMRPGFSLAGAVIVEEKGPETLRELLVALLASTPAEARPMVVEVAPGCARAFRGLEYPAVEVKDDQMLQVVLEDMADAGQIHDLPVWRGMKTSGGEGRSRV